MILDGKKIAREIYSHLSNNISKKNGNSSPTLGVILVGNNPASVKYINQKKKFCEQIGMHFQLFQYTEEISQEELIKNIISLNQRDDISGYIVQLPLPKHIHATEIIAHMDPKKDVDGFHPENQGKILIGDTSGFPACTPAGIMQLLAYYDISLSGKSVCILGQSAIVGKPMAAMCINAGATVTSCNHRTPNISTYTKQADIIISATGVIGLISPEIVSKNAIIIDVGFSVKNGKIYGDAQTQKLIEQGNSITPVPGGVGAMTVAQLLVNTYRAYESQR